MLIFFCLGRFFRFPVHPLADQQIGFPGIFHYRRMGTGIGTVGQFDSLPWGTHDHFRPVQHAVLLHRLSLLQPTPQLQGNSLFFRPLHLKLSASVNFQRISVTDHIMIHPEGCDVISANIYRLHRLPQFDITDGKREFRRDYPQRGNYSLQPPGTDQCQRLRPVRVPHGQKQTRQSADMISVIMRKADHIDGFKHPSLFFYGNLRAFPAVDQKTAAVIPRHQRSQPPTRKRHHAAASQ